LQQADAERESQWEPKKKMQPVWRRKRDLNGKGGGHDNVSGNENDEVRWRVIGAVVVKGLAADGASVCGLEEGPEQASLTAVRAATAQASHQSLARATLGKGGDVH